MSGQAAAIHDAESFRAAGFAPPDVYFTPAYGEAEVAQGAGAWRSIVAFGGRWQMPLHVREDHGLLDAVTPYGYSGVYASEELSLSQRDQAWAQAQSLMRGQGLTSLFIRQSSLVAHPFSTPPGRTVVAGHHTTLVATRDTDEAWVAMQGRSRTSVRKADRDGYVSTVRPAVAADLQAGSPFRSMYENAMRRRNASSRYFFSDSYYESLRQGLGDDLLLGLTLGSQGEPACAALFMRHGSLLHYHLSGSDNQAGKAGATNQLIWSAVRWSAASGVAGLHLGGGVSPGDSLFKFKQSFGGDVLDYNAYGVVLNNADYARAARAHARRLGLPEEEVMDTQHFPAYRATI